VSATDIPDEFLTFVAPDETVTTYRVVLWAAGGQGKTVAAASAPSPILVLSADRPTAYLFARKHHGHTPDTLRETRYKDAASLDRVYRYVKAHPEIRTVVIDPIGHIIDNLVDTAPLRADGDPDYVAVNKKVLGFVKSFRALDVNVVLVAHEKLNDGKRGDGKLYPALGGPSLINKLVAEMDIVAHVERHVTAGEDEAEVVRWVGQLQPRGNLVCKEGLGVLGERRILDLSRWFEVASEALAPDTSDVPFAPDFEPATEEEEQRVMEVGPS
jgi:hypothetical protein